MFNVPACLLSTASFKMAETGTAEEYEPIDTSKKVHIDDVLMPELDDAIVRVANMRKKQPAKCKNKAWKVAVNTVKYYSQFSIECEREKWDIDKSTVQQGLSQYGSIDFSKAQNLSFLSKTLRDCLTERNETLKEKEKLDVPLDNNQKNYSKLKPIPFFHTISPCT